MCLSSAEGSPFDESVLPSWSMVVKIRKDHSEGLHEGPSIYLVCPLLFPPGPFKAQAMPLFSKYRGKKTLNLLHEDPIRKPRKLDVLPKAWKDIPGSLGKDMDKHFSSSHIPTTL